MPRRLLAGGLAGLAATIAAGNALARDCDRACALGVADKALAAFQAGDPGKVLRSVRITENGRDIRLADSQLHAIRRVTYTHVFAEPAAGAVGLVGAAEAAGGPAVFLVRLKLKGDAVREAETVVVRRGEAAAFSPQAMSARPLLWELPLPVADRTPREAMITAAEAWFDAVQSRNADAIPAAAACSRDENGARTDNCRPTGEAGVVRDRRYPLVDEERGLVWVIAAFEVPAAAPGTPGSRRAAHSILAGHLFRIASGRIQAIEAVTRDMPPGAATGWALPKPRKK